MIGEYPTATLEELNDGHWNNGRVQIGAKDLGLPVHIPRSEATLKIGALAAAAEAIGLEQLDIATWRNQGVTDVFDPQLHRNSRQFQSLYPNTHTIVPYAAPSREGARAGIWVNINEIVRRVDNDILVGTEPIKSNIRVRLQAWYGKAIFDCMKELMAEELSKRHLRKLIRELRFHTPLLTIEPVKPPHERPSA